MNEKGCPPTGIVMLVRVATSHYEKMSIRCSLVLVARVLSWLGLLSSFSFLLPPPFSQV